MNVICCKACLIFGVKMYILGRNEILGKAYLELTQISLLENNQYVCYECAWLLRKFWKFKMKCLEANGIIEEIKSIQGSVEPRHKQVLKNINRTKFSTLSKVRNNPVIIETFEDNEKQHTLCNIKNESVMDKVVFESENTFDRNDYIIENNELTKEENGVTIKDENKNSTVSDLSDVDLKALDEFTIDTGVKQFKKSIEVCIDTNITEDDIAIDRTVHEIQPLLASVLKQTKSKKFNPSKMDNYKSVLIKTSQNESEDTINKVYKYKLRNRHYDNSTALENHLKRHSSTVAKSRQVRNIPQIGESSVQLQQDDKMDSDVDAVDWQLLDDTSDELCLPTDTQSDISNDEACKNDKMNADDKVVVPIKVGSLDDKADTKQTNKHTLKPRKMMDPMLFKRYVTVKTLSTEEAKKEFLCRKENEHYQKADYKCMLCYKFFSMKRTFDIHMKQHTDKMGPLKCEICSLRFPTKSRLYMHWHSNHERKFSCKSCPYVCYCRKTIITHIDAHRGKQYPCPECNQVFKLSNYLNKHKRKYHGVEQSCVFCGHTVKTDFGMVNHVNYLHPQEVNEQKGPKCEDCDIHFANELAYKVHLVRSSKHTVSNGCRFCGEVFSEVSELRSHTRIHSEWVKNNNKCISKSKDIVFTRNVPCPICETPLLDEDSFLNHMRDVHPDSDKTEQLVADNNLMCEVCGVTLKNTLTLMFHLLTHGETKSYKCGQCHKRFPTVAERTSHVATHADKSYACHKCGKLFKTRTLCEKHLETHVEERNFKCGQCSKSFRTTASLYIHKFSHVNHSIKCDQCDKVFKTKYTYQTHMKTHTGTRDHKCPICEKAFYQPCHVKYHVRHVHDRMPWPKRDRKREPATRTKYVEND